MGKSDGTAPVLALAVGLAACGSGGDPVAPATAVATPRSALAHSAFRDCAGFRDYYARALSREYLEGAWFGAPCWGCEPGVLSSGAPSGAQAGFQDSAMGAPPAAVAVSRTNTQEAGVDEADLVDADPASGRFYLLRGYGRDELLTARAMPPEDLAVASRLSTGDQVADGLYLDPEARRLAVVASRYGWMHWDSGAGRYDGGGTQLLFYDLADPDRPQLSDRYEISGYVLGSRRVGSRLHLVTSSPMGLPSALARDPSFFERVYQDYHGARQRGDRAEAERLAAEIRARIASAVGDADLAELLPVWRQGLDSVTAPQPLACEAITHPQVDERLGLVVISSIDTDGSDLAQAGALNNGWQLYGSAEHLYLAQWSGGWWWSPAQRQQTALYRYRLDPSGPARPAGHGVVDGWLHDRYALSEHDGALRVAVTEARHDSQRGWQRSNHLFVLDAGKPGTLDVIGQVRDFMRDESIFAARFIGARGYVVTFRIVDPLFTFDLSDPRAPRLTGELEVPGVSTYLHPHGDAHLLAVGRSVTPGGFWGGQVQLQLFDVGVLESPQLLDTELIGGDDEWAWSVAQYEPQAFTGFGDVVAVPVEISAGDWRNAFSGFVAYRVALPSGFTELGRVDHKQPDDGSGSGCPATTDGSDAPCHSFAPVVFNPPLRSVVATEDTGRVVLYTLSDAWLKAHALGDGLQEIRALPLRAE